MKDRRRKENARVRAEIYAPAPRDSSLLYGVIGAAILVIIVVAVGAFYNIDLLRNPLPVAALAVAAFGAGLLARRLQLRRHRRAHRLEYDAADRTTEAPQDRSRAEEFGERG